MPGSGRKTPTAVAVQGPLINLGELTRLYVEQGRALPKSIEQALRADDRPGAKKLLEAVARRRRDNRSEGQRLRTLLVMEQTLWEQGIQRVAGIDEAGMSPLAGPVAAAAVVFAPGTRISGVNDSKILSASDREALAPEIKAKALAWCVAFTHPLEIDDINIYWAGLLAMERAVEGLRPAPQHLLIDGRRLEKLPMTQQKVIKGDARCFCIAAASILAKTARDAVMVEMDRRFPGYGFARHKGYPVAEHIEALQRLGPSPIHRRSFTPVRIAMGLPPASPPASAET